jgi:hypothetical protein
MRPLVAKKMASRRWKGSVKRIPLPILHVNGYASVIVSEVRVV